MILYTYLKFQTNARLPIRTPFNISELTLKKVCLTTEVRNLKT